jgi:hypothetical protein
LAWFKQFRTIFSGTFIAITQVNGGIMLSKIVAISIVLSPLLALADSGESKSFVFQGQPSVSLVLSGEKTHTEYRTETYQTTCYRSEFSHYEQRCYNEPINVCDMMFEQLVPGPSNPKPGGPGGDPDRPPRFPEPGPSEPRCRTEYRRSCSQEAVYVNVPYSCTQTRQIPFEVKDADTLNRVIFNFGAVPAGISLNDTFAVKASGIDISVNAQSNQVFYSLNKQQVQSNKGNLIEATTTFNVAIDSIAGVNAAVAQGLTELTATADGVSFMIGKVLRPELLVVNLKIKQSQFLGSKTLIERDLQPSEITLTDVGDKTRVDVKNSPALGLKAKKTVKITAKVRLSGPGNIANPGALSVEQPEMMVKIKL